MNIQPREFARYLLEILEQKKSSNKIREVLDVGCGNGNITKEVTSLLNCNTLGVDISTVDIANAIEKNALPNIKYRELDGFSLSQSLAGRKFDLIMLIGSRITDLSVASEEKIKETLCSYRSLLNQGGIILIQENTNFSGKCCARTGWKLKTRKELSALFGPNPDISYFVKRSGILKRTRFFHIAELLARMVLGRFLSFIVIQRK